MTIEKRHNVFISYHHSEEDTLYQKALEQILIESNAEKVVTSRRNDFSGIPPRLEMNRVKQLIRQRFLRNTTVTVVLVGKETWKRKHIDWEISASISDNSLESRSGLVGILLPSHPDYQSERISPFTLPPRLHDNIQCGYAKLYKWNDDPQEIQEWIHEAFMSRQKLHPNDSRAMYNRDRIGLSWKP